MVKDNSYALALQLIVLSIVFLPVLNTFFLLPATALALTANIFFLVLLFKWSKTKKEKKLKIIFFGLLLLSDISFIATNIFQNTITGIKAVFFISLLAVFFLFFSKKFLMKNYCNGKVLCHGKNIAVIETEFDFLTGIKKGKYIVDCEKKVRTGETVKAKIKNTFFERKPFKII